MAKPGGVEGEVVTRGVCGWCWVRAARVASERARLPRATPRSVHRPTPIPTHPIALCPPSLLTHTNAPMPKPRKMRPMTSMARFWAAALRMPPSKNQRPPDSIEYLRPDKRDRVRRERG